MQNEQDHKFEVLLLGDLPTAALAKHGLNLSPARVRFTIAAQKHALSRHPDEYELCVPFLTEIVGNPTYVGQAPNHKDSGFELVLETQANGLILLMAILLQPTVGGYIVKSVYPINQSKLQNRILKGFLTKA